MDYLQIFVDFCSRLELGFVMVTIETGTMLTVYTLNRENSHVWGIGPRPYSTSLLMDMITKISDCYSVAKDNNLT